MGFKDLFKKREPYDIDSEPFFPIFEMEAPQTQRQKTNASKPVQVQIPVTPAQRKPSSPTSTQPSDPPFTGFKLDELPGDSTSDARRPRQPKTWPPFTPIYEKRNIIILAVENTAKVCEYRSEVLRLVKKIIEDNKTALFMFLRLGNNCKYFEVFDTEKLKVENLPECLLDSSTSSSEDVNLADALTHICEFSKSFDSFLNLLKYDNISYRVEDLRIIFIGTGNNSMDSSQSSELLEALRTKKDVKAIKYFCIKDKDAIQAASNGFPVIGHIESNFYK